MIPFLLDTLFATGALIALVLVLRAPVARTFGAQFAYALWLLPLLRFVMPPLWLPASFAPVAPAVIAEPTVSAGVTEVALSSTPATVADAAVPMMTVADEPGLLASIPWGDVLIALWLGGAAAFLAWRWHSYRLMRRDLLAQARPVGEAGRIRLVETPAVSAPVAFGVTDKVVALPVLFMALEDRTARDLAIAHELAHHRGRDLSANILAQPILALHWFNPLAWLAWRAMRRDQEAACDARVMAAQGRSERARYAQVIASFAAGPRLALAAPMACPMLGEKSIIHRLRSLTRDDISRRRRALGRGLLLAGGLALPLTATVTYAASEAPEVASAPKTIGKHRVVIVDADEGTNPDDPALRTHTVTREGHTVVLKTSRPLSDAEVRDRVDEAFGKLARVDDLSVAAVPPVPPAPPVLSLSPVPPIPPIPAAPSFSRSARESWSASDEREFERKMDAWSKQMEKWADKYAESYARQAERYARQAERQAERAERNAPEVVESCAGNPTTVTRNEVTSDGRQRIVICERVAAREALGGLRTARATIAGNREMDPDVRAEVLNELDSEIARIESDS